jgi:uncharacterized protein (TIGR03435 family)
MQAAKAPAYEVVSVKPSKPSCPGMSLSSPPGRYMAHCVTVWGLIYNAYEVGFGGHAPGLPGWADSAEFDVDAKMDDDTAAAMRELSAGEQGRQRQLMLRALLADRFKLQGHTETETGPIYQLVIAKGGARLKPWPAGEKTRGTYWGGSRIRMEGGGIEGLASCLGDTLGRTVVNKTGIAGNYDIDLRWGADDQESALDGAPALITAIQEQLGLKLVSGKGPVQKFVVDHVEKPSEN